MKRTFNARKLRFLYILPCFAIVSSIVAILQTNIKVDDGDSYNHRTSRTLLQASNESLFKCIPSGIYSFPQDFFTQQERINGGVVIHILIAFYICATIAIVCDDYFIPSLEIISDRLKLPSDVAGATFMAIGTSAPELFSSITGSFITEGDIGVGTIIGSAVFNILAVTGLVGLVLWDEVLDIDWYPIARDCIAYGLTVSVLIWIISNNIVLWWEALILLVIFLLYILILCFNDTVEKYARNLASKIGSNLRCCCSTSDEKNPLLGENKVFVPEILDPKSSRKQSERDSFSVEFTASKENAVLQNAMVTAKIEELEVFDSGYSDGSVCTAPTGGPWIFVWWIVMYPATLVFFLTIPDSRKPHLRKLFPITFFISVAWIGVLSYLAVWMVTIVGYTFSIPDSVSGLTILAAGTSVPEVITSIIVAKSGFGNMAISNLVGSNTFDISFCLGAPWLAKTLVSEKGYLVVYSSALTYTTATLLITLACFVLVFQFSGWKLNRAVGIACFVIYIIFVILACMYELNVFGEINVPTCDM